MIDEEPKTPSPADTEGKKVWYQDALDIFARLSGWVLLPLLAGTFVGRWLDGRYGTKPLWLLISVGVSFVISTIGLIRQAKIEFKKLDQPKK